MKIAILGMGTGWDIAKKEDYDELWGVNSLILRRDDLDLMFQLHNLDWCEDGDTYLKTKVARENFNDSVKKINDLKIPVIVQAKHKLFPHGTVFPLKEMPAMYFTNSFAYMLAYAIHKRINEIDLYGVPLSMLGEYREQRSCIEFWIGFAAGRGIRVTVYGITILLSSIPHEGLYGYDW